MANSVPYKFMMDSPILNVLGPFDRGSLQFMENNKFGNLKKYPEG